MKRKFIDTLIFFIALITFTFGVLFIFASTNIIGMILGGLIGIVALVLLSTYKF